MKKPLEISQEPQNVQMGEKVSDRLIWHSCQEGNKKAIEVIYDKNYELLLNVGYKVIPSLAVVEDHIQDLFVYIWKNRSSIDIKTNMRVYLVRSLRNNLVKYVEKSRKFISDENLNDTIQTQDDKLLDSDSLKTEINMLPDKQMEIVYLKYFQNFEGNEIAEIMDISVGSAYNLLSRAIRNLRKKVTPLAIISIFFQLF